LIGWYLQQMMKVSPKPHFCPFLSPILQAAHGCVDTPNPVAHRLSALSFIIFPCEL